MTRRGQFLIKGNSGPIWERTRNRRREKSKINFVVSKRDSQCSLIKTSKLLLDYKIIYSKQKVNLNQKVEEKAAWDGKKLNKIVEDLKEKNAEEEKERWFWNLKE